MANGQDNILEESTNLFQSNEEEQEEEGIDVIPENDVTLFQSDQESLFEEQRASISEEESLFRDRVEETPSPDLEGSFIEQVGRDLIRLGGRSTGATTIPGPPETRFFSGVNDLFQGIGILGEGLLKGIAAVDKNLANNLAEASEGAEGIDEDITDPGDIEDYSLYKAGQFIKGGMEEVFPNNPEYQGEFLASTLPRGIGTFAGQTGAALATGGASSIALTSLAFSGLEYDRALEETGDEDTAFQTMMLNMPINSIEQLPVLTGISKINKTTGGGFTKMLKRLAQTRTGTGIMEGTQEVVQEWSQNLVAQNMYDESVELMQGLDQAGAAGAIIGIGARSMGISLREAAQDRSKSPQERAEAVNSLEFLSNETSRMIDEGRINVREIDPLLVQGGTSGQGSRVGKARIRNMFDPDVVPEAQSLFEGEGAISEDFNQEAQDVDDISPEQSTLETRAQESWENLKTKTRHWLAPEGKYPREVFDVIMDRGDLNRDLQTMQFILKDMESILKNEFDIGPTLNPFFSNKIPQEDMTSMREFLKGERDITEVRGSLREPITKMRRHIDFLSRRYRKAGFSEGQLDISIKENIGSYIHRTYKVHTQPDWADKVPEDVKKRARVAIEDMYKESGVELGVEQRENIINTLLYSQNDSPIRALRKGNINSMDLSPLMKRKDIPAPIRELLGEETNPIVNYAKSVQSISNLFQQQKTLTELRDRFKGTYFFEEGEAPREFYETLAPEGTDSMAPLAGLKTSPEIKEAFEEVTTNWKTESNMMKGYLMLNAGAKFSKTVLNPTTISRNVLGGSFFLMANGHNPLGGNFMKGYRAARDVFRNRGSEEGRQKVLEYAELNLLGSSPQAGETMDLVGDISQAENYEQLQEFMMGKGVLSTVGRAANKASEFYQAGDNLMRVSFFEAELSRMREAGLGENMTDQELKQEAADKTNRLYQNYDYIPEAVKRLRKYPVAPFISFQYEVVRTTTNLVNTIREETSSDNPEVRKMGYKRLAGAGIVGGGMAAAGAMSKALLGMDEDEEEDIRRFAAPWDQNSTLIFMDSDRGMAKYINGSYIDPYEYLKDPMLQLLTGRGEEDFMDSLVNSVGTLMEPLFQSEIFVKQAREALSNSKDAGGTVYNPEESLGRKAGDVLAHLWDAFNPGFARNTSNLYEAIEGTSEDETDREVPTEILALFGLRVTKVDFERGLEFKVTDFTKARRNSKSIYNEALYDEDVGRIGEEEAFQRANRSYRENWENMSRDIEAAMRKGVPSIKIEDILSDKNVSQDDIQELMFGSFRGFERDLSIRE